MHGSLVLEHVSGIVYYGNEMETNLPERQQTPTVTVEQLKRYGYSVTIVLSLLSMIVTLIFGSPTFALSPATTTFDYYVYPVLIVLGLLVVRAILNGRVRIERFEKGFVAFFSVFFVSKFSLTLLAAPTLLSIAYVESWYWMMVGGWTMAFLAYSFRQAIFLNVAMYSMMVIVIVTNAWLKAPPDEFFGWLSNQAASTFRFGASLAMLVILGYVKEQWLSVEKEAVFLRSMAHIDALTGLPNRRHLNETLESIVKRGTGPLTVVLFDLDGFKQVNDVFGHIVGDEVLRSIGTLARNSARRGDTIGRWGGEEFLAICPNTTLAEGVRLAEDFRRTLASHTRQRGRPITASFGVAELKPGENGEQLIARADAALYAAKAHGKNAVFIEEAGHTSPATGLTDTEQWVQHF